MVIRSRKSKDRQYNGKNIYKRTMKYIAKDWTTLASLHIGRSERVDSACSTSSNRRYQAGDKLWMRKWPDCDYDKWTISVETHLALIIFNFTNLMCFNTVVSNHVNSDHVPSFSCLDVWTNRQATSGVYAITVTTS